MSYLTFDGELYNFNQSCSYYVMKEIIPKYNLTVIVNNRFCSKEDPTFCTQALIVNYKQYTIVLTSQTNGMSDVVSIHSSSGCF